jgi:hypothetical protein
MSKERNIYQERGYKNREAYLRELAAENGADVQAVFALADMLGPSEDFDGLVSSIEDWDWEN